MTKTQTRSLAVATIVGGLLVSTLPAFARTSPITYVRTLVNKTGNVVVRDNLVVKGNLMVLKKMKDGKAGNGQLINVTALDTAGTTIDQNGLAIHNLAGDQAADALVVLENEDTDTAVDTAIKLVNAGGGFSTLIDNGGTLLSGAELNVLDDGVSLGELSNNGTLTASTVDIDGGTVDATVIGSTTPAMGSFTNLLGTTLSLNPNASLSYDGANSRVQLTGSTGSLHVEDKMTYGRQTFTMSTAGIAQELITPTATYVEITGQDDASDNISLATAGAQEGQLVILSNQGTLNVTLNAGTNVKLNNNSNKTLTPYSTITLIFDGVGWIEIAHSFNS